jgi:hypothetical protein
MYSNKTLKNMKRLNNYLLLAGTLVLGLASCRKDTNGIFAGKGAPVITSVRTVSKTDTIPAGTLTTYDSTGVASTKPGYSSVTPVAFDSTTATGNLSNTYAILGKNLGSTTKIVLNGVSLYFNRALNSDNVVIFTIPATIPTAQPQTNNIVLTTLYGSVTYKFTVLPPPPTIEIYSTNDFTAGSEITLNGLGLSSVTAVTLKTTGDAATIISKNDSTLVLKMPQSAATESPLVFTYTSGSNTGATATSAVLFNDLDNAYVVFTDNYGAGWYSNSWGPGAPSTAQAKTGTTSFAATYPKGNYWADGFGDSGSGLPASNYTYLSFWIKGGIEDYTLYLTADTRSGGFGNSDQSTPITVPKQVWTYIKLPLAKLSLQGSQHFGLWIAGPADQDETFYLDDVVLLK